MDKMKYQCIKKKPKHSIGKITNKYLIFDIYSYAYITREEAMYRMFKLDRSLRNLLIESFKILPPLIPHSIFTQKVTCYGLGKKITLTNFSTTITCYNQLNNHINFEIQIYNLAKIN